MPSIVDYDTVLATAEAAGFRCGYPFGSVFVLAGEGMTPGRVACWSAGDDATVRPRWRPTMRPVAAERLAPLAARVWREAGGDVWLAPVHSWASELQHGDGDWLEPLLIDLGLDPTPLRPRTKADALAFSPGEADAFERALATILDKLWLSDFALLLPGAPRGVFCTVHHHKQLWWQCVDASDAKRLLTLADAAPSPE